MMTFKSLFLSITIFCICVGYFFKDISEVEIYPTIETIFLLLIIACLVHLIKMVRLYLALYGNGVSFRFLAKIYCSVTPVSLLLPYKLGDLYRMYIYGNVLRNRIRGIVIILLDRFMDTSALVTIIIFFKYYNNSEISIQSSLLMVFLLVVIIAYNLFGGLHSFWNQYLLAANATKKRLWALDQLAIWNKIYVEIKRVVVGRGAVLYALSLLAWSIELGGMLSLMAVLSNFEDINLSKWISTYLATLFGEAYLDIIGEYIVISTVGLVCYSVLLRILSKGSE